MTLLELGYSCPNYSKFVEKQTFLFVNYESEKLKKIFKINIDF